MPFQKIPEDFQVWTSKELNEYLKTLEDQLQFAKMFPGDDPDFLSSLEMGASACRSEITRRNGARTQNGASPQEEEPLVQIMETIEKEDIDFLWKDRIPRGKLTLFSGDPGIGKSTVASMIAATISRSDPLPFDKGSEVPLKSLIVSTEDTPADVLRPRLERMKADLSMIAIPSRKVFSTPSQVVQRMDEIFKSLQPALVIFDPIIAYTGGRNTDKAAQVRDFLTPLSTLAEQYRAAVILISHYSKEKAVSAIYRAQGSIDWMASARSAFGFGHDRDNRERRFFTHIKSSVSKLQPTLEYFIDDDGTFRWGVETPESADEILSGQKPPDTTGAVKAFLERILENGPLPENEIKDKAAKEGMNFQPIWNCGEKLKAQGKLKKSQERETGAWFWRLT